MPRSLKFDVVSATIGACLLAGSFAHAETVQERALRCMAQSGIVAQAVEHRLKKRSQKRADKLVRRSDAVKDGPYERHVDLLVNWVYTLPPVQLGPAVSVAFETACNQYDG